MRCLLVLCAVVAMASAIGGDRGDRDDSGVQYNGGYGDNGDRGSAGGFYIPENQPLVLETLPPIPIYSTTPKPKEHPINNYQYKYALGDVEKQLLLTLNLDGDSDDLNKAFFDYTNSKNQVYRTDYIADAAHAEHVL